MSDDATWENHYRAAKAAWPGVELTLAEFRAYVEERQRDELLDEAKLATGDLYLACACAAGKPGALEIFWRACGAAIDGVVRRLGPLAGPHEDAVQTVNERLFAGPRSKIVAYRGKGPLKAWVRVVALRALLNERESLREDPFESDEGMSRLLSTSDNPELELMKRSYGYEFREALKRSILSLHVKERVLLRLSLAEGLNIDALGELYGVHRATAARWVRDAHGQLARGVRENMRAVLGVSDAELESILRLVLSGLDTSLSRYLV